MKMNTMQYDYNLIRKVKQPSVRCYGAKPVMITSCSGNDYWYKKMLNERIEVVSYNDALYMAVQRDKSGNIWFDGYEYLVLRSDAKTTEELKCVFRTTEGEYINFNYNKAKKVRIKRVTSSFAWYAAMVGEVIYVNSFNNQYYLCPSQSEALSHYLIPKTDVRDLTEDLENEIRCLVIWLKENPWHNDFYKNAHLFSNRQMQLEAEIKRTLAVDKHPANARQILST